MSVKLEEKSQKYRKHATILLTRVDSTETDQVLNKIEKSLQKKEQFFITTPNPEILTMAYFDTSYREILNSASTNIADGKGVELASFFLGQEKLKVIRGRELFEEILNRFSQSKRNRKVFLLGSTKEVVARSVERITNEYRDIQVMGVAGPKIGIEGDPVTKRDQKHEKDAIDKINNFHPDILFVAFGAPKQERWIARWLPNLKVGGAMGVGGTFDYFSGAKPVPPKWLANAGFEWLWRLAYERGHAKRIFRATFIFPLLVFKQRLHL